MCCVLQWIRKYSEDIMIPKQSSLNASKWRASSLGECPICFYDMIVPVKYFECDKLESTSCGHVFHQRCISKWLKNADTCPMCNNAVVREKTDRT